MALVISNAVNPPERKATRYILTYLIRLVESFVLVLLSTFRVSHPELSKEIMFHVTALVFSIGD